LQTANKELAEVQEVVQLCIKPIRLGHTKSNASLHLFGKHSSGNCETCSQLETVEHVLFVCTKYSLKDWL